MYEINCAICMDLIPLVADGVASEDSRLAVEAHLETCPACRALYRQDAPPPADTMKAFAKVASKIRVFWGMLLMFGVVYGLSLTASSGLFYNILLMPAIGALGYGLFRWKALYRIPLVLFGTHLITNFLGLGREVLDLLTLFLWNGYYCLFAGVGMLIAWLLHYAFRKER